MNYWLHCACVWTERHTDRYKDIKKTKKKKNREVRKGVEERSDSLGQGGGLGRGVEERGGLGTITPPLQGKAFRNQHKSF